VNLSSNDEAAGVKTRSFPFKYITAPLVSIQISNPELISRASILNIIFLFLLQ
jgi:hypothetical protein